MAASPLVERSFYVPINRNANLSDGLPHETMVWEQFSQEMFVRFEGGTRAPVLYRGFYRDPDQGTRVDDESLRYIVALPEAKVDEFREFLREACELFQQNCIYLAIAGRVEFIGLKTHETY